MEALSDVVPDRPPPPAQADLIPDRSRVDQIDLALRQRLAKSLEYIGAVVSERDDGRALPGLDALQRRVMTNAVSPWLFCLYSRLVTELAKEGAVEVAFDDVVRAASLPPDQGIVAFRDPRFAKTWWDHLQLLLDTDRRRPFRPQTPEAPELAACERDVRGALALLSEADPAWFEELSALLRVIVLAAPSQAADGFNGASTFFVWGGSMLNAALPRSTIAMVDLLVHESSHVLLFGLSADEPLTRNDGQERYASPLRSDARPIDGIFHGCFVTTRVHLAMRRLIDSQSLSVEDASEAAGRAQYNGDAARTALDLLERHALLTPHGERILGELQSYWRTDTMDAGGVGGAPSSPTTDHDKIREVVTAALRAGCGGFAPNAAIAKAIADRDRGLTIDQLKFDSLAWMEFCISVELQCGQELTPADIDGMHFFHEIEEWLRARL